MDRREFLAAAAALPVALRYAPESLAGGPPLALVTADAEARVVAVDPSTGLIRRSLATLPGPRSIETVGGRLAVVAHTRSGDVSVLDGGPLRVRHLLHGFREPRYTAAHPDGRHCYVTDSASGYVVAVDAVGGRALGHAALGGPSRHVTIDPRGRTLWVSLGSKADRIAIVDVARPDRPRLVRHVRPPFLAHDVGFAPGGRHVWVSSADRGALAVYDARSGRLLRAGGRRAAPARDVPRRAGVRRERRRRDAPRPLPRRRPPAAGDASPSRLVQRPAGARGRPDPLARARHALRPRAERVAAAACAGGALVARRLRREGTLGARRKPAGGRGRIHGRRTPTAKGAPWLAGR